MRRFVISLGAALLIAAPGAAQAPDRIATTAQALVTNPLFFNGKRIVIRQPVKISGQLTELDGTAKPVYVLWRDKPGGTDGEIRGDFYDLGRMIEGDQRFTSYDFAPVVQAANNGRWPGRDQVFVILGATFVDNPAPTTPTIRSIALVPEQFDNRSVTLVGRFRGRNLYGDLPQGVARSKWDFVLQSADAAIWITGLRPKGKDFDLDPSARVDTGKWLEVKGRVERDTNAVWITAESIRLTTAPADSPVEVAAPPVPAEPPPSVIFSAPLADDTDVPVAGRIRIQFSRDMKGESFRERVRVRYGGTPPVPTAPPNFTVTYNDGNRSIEIRFKEPLMAFQVVVLELTNGITAIDGQPLQPWTLKFTTGQ
ncbi:MAG TPA: Ig-like domain-containing protein [Vicinamibacterales bacterium]|nr:Ig-like domain-containing protein [Vicinamibacterales bacterium]